MKKNIFTGALLLSFGGLVCKVIGAIYKIPLSNILGAEGMGIYQLSYPLYAFLLVFVSGGIPYALSSFVAKARAKNETKKIYSYFYYAFAYSLFLGVCFFLFLIIFAKNLAILQGNQMAILSYYGFAVTIFFSCMLPCFRGLFQGFENFVPTFFSQIIEQIFKLVLGLILAYFLSKYSLALGVLGASLGVLAGEVISFLYLLIYFSKTKRKYNFINCVDKSIGKDFLKYSFTFTLTALIIPFLNVYQSFVVIPLLENFGLSNGFSTTVYGIQTGMVNSIINFPTVISTSFAIVLMPSLSFYFETQKGKISQILQRSLKVIFMFCIPCIVGIFVLAPFIMELAFPSLDSVLRVIGSNLLKISSFNILFLAISQITTIALQGIKKQNIAFKNMLIFALVYLIFLPILLINFGIYGIVLNSILTFSVLSIINIIQIKKIIKFSIKILDFIVIFSTSIFIGFIAFFVNDLIVDINIFLSLFFAVFLSILIYFVVMIIFKTISIKELKLIINKKIKSNKKLLK